MKNIYQTFFIFSLIFSLSVNVFSQENYLDAKVLSLNNDTLSGLINYQEWERNPKAIKFKSSGSSIHSEYSAEDISAFWVNNDYYVSREITITEAPRNPDQLTHAKEKTTETKTVFVLVLVAGEASLYEYVDEMSTERYYLEQKRGEVHELIYFKYYVKQPNGRMLTENRKYGGQLIYFFQDCDDIKNDINGASYKASDLMKITEQYNTCKGSKNEYVHVKEKNKTHLGIIAGASFTIINFDNYNYRFNIDFSEFKPSVFPTLGFTFELILPRSRGKWSWYNDLILKHHCFKSTYIKADSEYYSAKYTTTINATYLKWTTMARFHIVGHKVIPYFGGGLFGSAALSMKNEQVQEIRFGNETRTETVDIFDPYGFDYGFALSIGGKLNNFHLEGRYDFGLVSTYGYLSSNTRTFYLLFGYTF